MTQYNSQYNTMTPDIGQNPDWGISNSGFLINLS